LSTNHTREIRIINIIVLCVVIFASVTPTILMQENINAVYVSPASFSNGTQTMEHRLLEKGDEKIDRFSTTIMAEDLKGLPKSDLGLVITRVDGQGYRVWWNGHFLGQAGDPYKGQANIWNSSHLFLIDGNSIEQQNTLIIQTYSLYEVGTYEQSIQITSWRDAIHMESRYNLLSNDLTLASIGMSIFAAITVLVHTALNAHNKKKMLAIMVSMLAVALYSVDYLKIDYLAMPYIFYKKIITIALYASTFFLSAAAGSTVKSKIPISINGLLLATYVIGMLFIRDMVTFKTFYNAITVLLPVSVLSWLIVLFPKMKDKIEARIFVGMLGITFIVGVWQVAALLYIPNRLVASPFPLILVTGALLTMFLALSTIEQNRLLCLETEQKNQLFLKAVNDAQTGIYNKPYFASRMQEMNPPFTLAMIDIDNFKSLNDTYGHLIGDQCILKVVKAIEANMNAGDFLGRYGGDEFMAVFRRDAQEAWYVCEVIRREVENAVIERSGMKVSVTVSIGVYHVWDKESVESIMQKADRALYSAKANGKNCLSKLKEK